jgi:outer membrane protein TolC
VKTRSPLSIVVALATFLLATTRASASPPAPSPPAPSPPAPPPSALEQRVEALEHPGGLTAEQAALRARRLSYEAQARRADSAVADQRVLQAELGFLPRVSARASYTRASDVGVQALGFTFPTDNWGLQVEMSVPISDYALRLAKQYTSAQHSAKAAAWLAVASEATASTEARLAYYAWARARLQELVALSVLELASDHLVDAKSSLAAGQASLADVMQVEAERAERELMVERARSAVEVTQAKLSITLHDPPRTRYEIGEALLAPLPPLELQRAYGALVEEALRRRPELKALRATSASWSDEASQQSLGLLPRLEAFGRAQYANPNPAYFPPAPAWRGNWAIGGVVSWTSGEAIVAGTSAGAAGARVAGVRAQESAVRDGIRLEVLQALRALGEAELALEAAARRLAAAEEAYRVRRALFRAAQATSTELGDTELALSQARFAAVDVRIDLRMARARLLHAVGRDVPEAR